MLCGSLSITLQNLQPEGELHVVHRKISTTHAKTRVCWKLFHESQGGTTGRPGDILISAVCLHACQVYSWMKDVSPCWARTRHTEVNKVSLISYSSWTDRRACVRFLSTGAQRGELQRLHQEAPAWSKQSDFIVPLYGNHVHLPSRIYSCHWFTANKALLCGMPHYKDMDVY